MFVFCHSYKRFIWLIDGLVYCECEPNLIDAHFLKSDSGLPTMKLSSCGNVGDVSENMPFDKC